MGTRYLVDTNIAIYILNGLLPSNAEAFLQPILNMECIISIITKIEMLGWQFKSHAEEQQALDFVQDSTVVPLSDEIALKTIELRKLRKMKLGDAIIAATALHENYTILTRNEDDFKNLPGVSYLNPFTA